jgi:hypothetical protein
LNLPLCGQSALTKYSEHLADGLSVGEMENATPLAFLTYKNAIRELSALQPKDEK